MTFTVEDMNRRSVECARRGRAAGADDVLTCVEGVLERMEIVERPAILRKLREAVRAELTEDGDEENAQHA